MNKNTLNDSIRLYLDYLHVLGRSHYTIKGAKYGLKSFTRYIEAIGIHSFEKITHETLFQYQKHLAYYITHRDKLLAIRSQGYLLGIVKGFCTYLYKQGVLLENLGKKIDLPKKPKVLPRVILNYLEIKQILKIPNINTASGRRDRVILEILYDTGLRAGEISKLEIGDMDLTHGFLMVREGKGNKDRVVPLSSRVCRLVKDYLASVRSQISQQGQTDHLVLNRFNKQLSPTGVWAIVKKYAKLCEFTKNVTTHTFRHSCATHMLNNGAPIRHIQELLGHESLETTQIYTRVTIHNLKESHTKYHPGKKL